MLTDRPPRNKALLAQFLESDRLGTLALPPDDRFRVAAQLLNAGMKAEKRAAVKEACEEFLSLASDFYGLPKPRISVLAARPLRVREGGATELFGDYNLTTGSIRVWMRTAVRKQVTSFGTFLSTLCHEFCHHLDCRRFGFGATPHTRGFYERAAALYHYARGTPAKRLFWIRTRGGCWRIDWPRTNRGG